MSDSQRLQTDLIKVVDAGRRPDKSLAPRAPATAIPSAAGAARPKRPAGSGAGTAGIASPLTEERDGGGVATTRTHYPEVTLTSSDGFIVFRLEHVEEITCLDANGAEVVLNFAKPA